MAGVRHARAIARIALAAATTLAISAHALIGSSPSATAAGPVPPFIPASAGWLPTVNYFRAMSGLGTVTEAPELSTGAYSHSCYMLYNGISHDETPGAPGYTAEGDTAGNAGNVAVSSVYGTSDRSHIELWMTGPFHAIGILRANLQTVGYGKCDSTNTSPWRSGATLNVLSGLGAGPRPGTPILFPGDGSTTNLSQFVTESPNPLTFCGWTGQAGLPVIAMMPEAVTVAVSSITGPNGPVQTCTLFSGNTTGAAKAILQGDNAVVVVPRAPLSPGTYTVNATTQSRNVTWSFTVDPAAANGVPAPAPTANIAGPASAFQPVTPFRFADSRISQRLTRLSGGVPKEIQVAGVGGLPTGITAISANFTVAESASDSYLTIYNCGTAPEASTLNFGNGETMANAGVFPLSSTGDLCIVSPVDTHLIIDINGYFRSSSTQRYTPLPPTQVANTQTGLRASGRLPDDGTLHVGLFEGGTGVPGNATAVALNVTAVAPETEGYVTAYPCDVPQPYVSNINPRHITKPNLIVVPVAADGSVCLYTTKSVDLHVDVLGYFSTGGSTRITPVAPTRVLDTRDVYRADLNGGTGGQRLAAGQTLTLQLGGQRGIPTAAKALSVNLTATDAVGGGFITVYPCGERPNVASAYFEAVSPVANGAEATLSSSGQLCVYASQSTNVIIDVTGWWS